MGFSTDCIHAGQEPEPVTGAVTVPIFQTSTYVQPELGKTKDTSTRGRRTRRDRPWKRTSPLSKAASTAHCFASGMSAIDTVFSLLQPGDHVVAAENMYGGSYRLFEQVLRQFGLDFTYVDIVEDSDVRRRIRPATKMLFLETPTNPMMTLTDFAACAEMAAGGAPRRCRQHLLLTRFFQQPIALGADIVVHSTTKFLNGHSDSVGGAVISNVTSGSPRDRLPAECRRRDPLAVRFLSRSARREDARGPDGAARRERHGDGRVPRRDHSKVKKRELSRSARSIRSTSWRSGRCAASAP